MRNTDIRERAKEKGVFLWGVAYALGMNDGNFSRKLRRELTDGEKTEIFAIIDRIAAERTATVAE